MTKPATPRFRKVWFSTKEIHDQSGTPIFGVSLIKENQHKPVRRQPIACPLPGEYQHKPKRGRAARPVESVPKRHGVHHTKLADGTRVTSYWYFDSASGMIHDVLAFDYRKCKRRAKQKGLRTVGRGKAKA